MSLFYQCRNHEMNLTTVKAESYIVIDRSSFRRSSILNGLLKQMATEHC